MIHNAQHAVVTNVPAGTTVHDQATVTGSLATPTGTVTFKWFTNGTCDGTAAATSGTFTLSGGVADGTSFTQTPNTPGAYSFQATYSGDSVYNGSTGACEPLTVDKISSNTTTVIHNAAHSVVDVGAGGHDRARPGDGDRLVGGTPTGTVTFKWFTNGTCTGTAAATSGTFTLSGGVADGTIVHADPDDVRELCVPGDATRVTACTTRRPATCEPLVRRQDHRRTR